MTSKRPPGRFAAALTESLNQNGTDTAQGVTSAAERLKKMTGSTAPVEVEHPESGRLDPGRPASERSEPGRSNVQAPDVQTVDVPALTVEEKAGWLKLPHTVTDSLMRQLDGDEFKVFVYLYSEGWRFEARGGRCEVSVPKIVEVTGVKRSKAFVAIKGLVDKRLIQKAAHGPGRQSGNEYHVERLLVEGEERPESGRPGRERSGSGRPQGGRSERGRSGSGLHVKEHEEHGKRTPVAVAPADISSILRTEAKKFREFYPAATDDVVRAKLNAFVKDRGWHVEDATIDEALKGMMP